jgi:hypothetical protein
MGLGERSGDTHMIQDRTKADKKKEERRAPEDCGST